jgi:hypothetical protein
VISLVHLHLKLITMKNLNFSLIYFLFSFYYLHSQVVESRIDSYLVEQLNNTQDSLHWELEKWCSRNRSFEEYQRIKSLNFWEKFNIEIIPEYEKDCRGYSFKLQRDTPLTISIIQEILISFKDY